MSRDGDHGHGVPDERRRAWGEKYEPRYSGVATFMRRPLRGDPEAWNGVDIGIVGVPFDGGVTNRPGARHGPRHLRDQSTLMGMVCHQTGVRPLYGTNDDGSAATGGDCSMQGRRGWAAGGAVAERQRGGGPAMGRYDLADVADLGDVPIEGVYRLDDAIADIERHYDRIAAAGVLPLSAGGDHSITLPIMRALARAQGQPLGLIHFDAHCDTGPELFGHKHHHGGPFKVAVEDGALDPKRTIQIGIRGPAEPLWAFSYESGMTVVHLEDLYAMGIPAVIKRAREVAGDGPTYLSFDVDGLDPVFAPGTGTPETGGFTTYEAQQMLRGLRGLDIVAGDVVEVSPPFDPSGTTGLTGAQMMFEILCLLAETVERRG